MAVFRTSATRLLSWVGVLGLLFTINLPAARVNHAGRLLGPPPVLTNAVLFNTPEADAIISAMQIFPPDNPWNEDVSSRPVLANSDAMIAMISSELLASRRTLRAFYEMNFVLVPDQQPLLPIFFGDYPDESDPGPYPIPSNLPIETWPRGTGSLTLSQWQEDVNDTGGDRHSIIVQPGTGLIWETWQTKRTGSAWEASNGAQFNLNSNALRPAGWTSGDAAGLSMLAGLVRYDECERGAVEHALRIVVKHTRRAYIYPATHHASVPSSTDPNVPAMGQRLRLKAGFVIPESWTKHEKAVLVALKKYGALVADNGNFFSISVAPDQRFPENAFSHLSSISVTNFEVIQTTGPLEGPRAPGAPRCEAGPDQLLSLGQPAILMGTITSAQPARAEWTVAAGPGMVSFGDPTMASTTASFEIAGHYTLVLSATDGLSPLVYDALEITVAHKIDLRCTTQDGTNVLLTWTGGAPPYELETASDETLANWEPLLTTSIAYTLLPAIGTSGLFRVKAMWSAAADPAERRRAGVDAAF